MAILKLKKINFTANKTLIFLNYVDIEKVLVSNKISFEEKDCNYFIGYFYNDHNINPLHIMLPKTCAYVKTTWMCFLIEDDDLLEKYNAIWDKIGPDIKNKFDSEPAYNKKN